MNAVGTLSSVAVVCGVGLLFSTFPVGCSQTPAWVQTSRPPLSPSRAVQLSPESSGAEQPVEHRSVAAPSRFAVASENRTATQLAMAILARGGSAVDAAVAGVLAVGVTQPVSSGIGGGGFALVWDAKTKKLTALDFREVAPIGIRPVDYITRPPRQGKQGVMVGVPGEVAGLTELHRRWGRLALVDLFREAADIAEKGFAVSAHLARSLKWNEKWILATPRYGFFHPAGNLLAADESVKNEALAKTLRKIGSEGKAAFYEGTIATDIIATAQRAGSRITVDDLKRYEVKERTALTTTWEGYEVFTMPPPSAGGLMLLETLHMHSKADLSVLGYATGAYFHMLGETFRGAIADRMHFIGDPAFIKMDVAKLVDRTRMKARRARIKPDTTTPADAFPDMDAGTSHLVTVDAEGNVVTITSTVNNMFGARLITEGGFPLNDELDDFTTARLSRRFGLRPSPNAPHGGARPVSSMTPTIVLKGQTPVLALGGSGGHRIATGTTQVLLGHIVFGRSVAEAVADPRIETPPTGGLLVERTLDPTVVKDLQKRGEVVDTTKPNFSAIQAISISDVDGMRRIEAAADARKGGSAQVQ